MIKRTRSRSGQRFRDERLNHNWSQQELADLVGTTPVTISRWETGVSTPSPYFRLKLEKLFGKSFETLGLQAVEETVGENEQLVNNTSLDVDISSYTNESESSEQPAPDQDDTVSALPIQPPQYNISSEQDQRRQNVPPPSGQVPINNQSSSTTVSDFPQPASIPPKPAKPQLWLAFLGIPLALLLIIGGVLLGLQLNRDSVTPGQTSTSSQVTATRSHSPSTTSTVSPTIPTGTQLYATSAPGCDSNTGNWVNYNGAQITCEGSEAIISNTAHFPQLQGTFLVQIPGHPYPSNYVVQAQFQQDPQSANGFGLYFRNQPGNQQGAYTFLIHPDGTWNAYIYDNNTGTPKALTGGTLGNAYAPITLAASANGQELSFYANNQILSTITDQTYRSGTVGIAVDQAAIVTVSNFVLSTIS